MVAAIVGEGSMSNQPDQASSSFIFFSGPNGCSADLASANTVWGEFSVVSQTGEAALLRRSDGAPGRDTALALRNWGGLTQNLPSDTYPAVITAIGLCKAASARVNFELGAFADLRLREGEEAIPPQFIFEAIHESCLELAQGKYNHEFVVDVLQGGAGTSLHMNANEVLARHANAKLVAKMGRDAEWETLSLPIHPNDIINYGQSTNDVIPTAARLAILIENRSLTEAMMTLESVLRDKAAEEDFRNTPMVGRTHLQDAVPVTMGQVFSSYCATLAAARRHIEVTSRGLGECTLGATAVGTGITALPGYREVITRQLNAVLEEHGIDVRLEDPTDYGKTTSSLFEISAFSNALSAYAVELGKFANDIRLYASGPRAGIGELALPPLQPGSSIMPGKVNPVMLEMLNQISFLVQGNGLAISLCAGAGQFQLNVMGPLVLWKLSESMSVLTKGLQRAVETCISEIALDTNSADRNLRSSLIAAPALKPVIGYDRAADLAKLALEHGISLGEALRFFVGEGASPDTAGLNVDQIAPLMDQGSMLALTFPPRPREPSRA